MNESVHWPEDEKILGVLGVAPLATLDFCRRLYDRPVRKDWEHLRVIMDCNPKIPSRGRFFELGETDPVPFIRKGIADLARRGTAVVAIPCNTAHILYERYSVDANVHLPNIIDITARGASALTAASGGENVIVLASRHVMAHGLYATAMSRYGLRQVEVESADQELVSQSIEAVKQNGGDEHMRNALLRMLENYSEANVVILGCTELSVLLGKAQCQKLIMDSNKELADYCYAYCQGNKTDK
jgi:aspartate racemase